MILLDRFLLVVWVAVSATAQAEVKEVKTMAEALKGADANTFIVFDIDNTLLEPDQMLGSDQWFEYYFDRLQKDGKLTGEAAEAETERVWGDLQAVTKVHAVEASAPQLIAALQRKGIPMAALTARPKDLMARTLKQLTAVGFKFSDGRVLFADGRNKGRVLLDAFTEWGVKPMRVVFIDDKKKNCTNVDNALVEAKIPVTAYRYGAADKSVKAFDPAIADIQFHYAQSLLSDSEARRLKQTFGVKNKVKWSHLDTWRNHARD